MFNKPVRYQNQKCLHFITFSCYHRLQLLDSDFAREVFERELERVRSCYDEVPVWTETKRIEKLRYIHRNPVRR